MSSSNCGNCNHTLAHNAPAWQTKRKGYLWCRCWPGWKKPSDAPCGGWCRRETPKEDKA